MAQVVIHEHDREHRLRDRRGAQPHTRIVAAGGHDLAPALPVDIDACRPGTWMLEVGLKVTCATTSWPEEMPPRMPPALLLRKPAA